MKGFRLVAVPGIRMLSAQLNNHPERKATNCACGNTAHRELEHGRGICNACYRKQTTIKNYRY